jgi:transcriptional pleiotropic repressor
MELAQVLEKNRTMHALLQKATVDALDFQNAAEQLHDLLRCSVYIINREGAVLGYRDTPDMQLFSLQELEEKCCSQEHQDWLLSIRQPMYNQWQDGNYLALLPVLSQSEQLGMLICGRVAEEFATEGQLLAEYAATLAAVMMIRAANRKAETEARKKNVVQLALEVLSYSELEAVKYIFNEIDGNEGFLVASKLAEEYKLTRSVIVNALRKLESAGVIDARSLGMKGTYIKILNDYLYEELAAI